MFSKGVQYMLLSTLFFALMNVCVKLVPHIPAVEIILFRSGISLLMSYAVLKQQGVSVWGTHKGLLISRGLTGAIALVLYFTTLQHIPLATAVTLQYLSPIFTTILGIFIVKEKVKPWQWLFFLVSFAGILVIEGVDTRISPFYLAIGVAGAAISGISYNVIRKLNTREHPLVIVFYFPLVALPFSAVYSWYDWVQPIGWDWLILILVGVFTQIAQYFMTMSYQSEELSKVANLNYIGIFYALLIGFFMFGEVFTFGSYAGMALVLLGVVLNIGYKNRLAKKALAVQ